MSRPSSRLRLAPRGWALTVAVLVVGPFGLWAHYPALIGLALAFGGLLAVGVIGVVVPAPLTVERTVEPARVQRNEPCTGTVTVANLSSRRWLSVVGYDVIAGRRLPFRSPAIGPGEREDVLIDVPTARRGVVELGPLTVRRMSVVELASTERVYGSRASVLVEPRILDGGGLPVGAIRGHVGADERVDKGGTDLVGLREYIAGDDLRKVHWATSARHGSLMVREDADPSMPYLTVLLDDRESAYAGDDFEEAVDVAASLLDTAARSGSPSRLLLTSGAPGIACPAHAAGSAARGLDLPARDALARVTTAATGQMVPLASRAGARERDVVVVVTGARAALPEMLHETYGASFGAVAVVDEQPERLVGAVGRTTVMRAPRSDDLMHAWRQAVAR